MWPRLQPRMSRKSLPSLEPSDSGSM